MLGRIRGKSKEDDEAMEALRRRTAARLAAIVGISPDDQPEDDLGPESAADATLGDVQAVDGTADDEAIAPDEGDGRDDAIELPADARPVLALTVPIVPFDFFAPDEPAAADADDGVAATDLGDLSAIDTEADADDGADLEAAPDVILAAGPHDEPAAAVELAIAAAPRVAAIDEDAPLAAFAEPERAASSAGSISLPANVVPVMAESALGRASADKPVRAAAPVRPVARPVSPAKSAAPAKARPRRRKGPINLPAACPSCGGVLDEVPTTARRCVECRQRIVVRRIEGRVVLVAEAVAPFFDAHRSRLQGGERIKREAGRWLQMAALAGAAPDVLEARARKVAARPTPEAVTSARALYATTVERACRAARKAHDWKGLADLRFRQAKAYHRAAGATVPAEPAILALHAEAVDASLRRIAELAREAELVGGLCCEACRAASGTVVRITAERRTPSVPHADCPAGLCACRWDVPLKVRQAKGPARRSTTTAGAASGRSRA
jgi:hypothetical protein